MGRTLPQTKYSISYEILVILISLTFPSFLDFFSVLFFQCCFLMDPPLALTESVSHMSVTPFLPPSGSQGLILSCHLFFLLCLNYLCNLYFRSK